MPLNVLPSLAQLGQPALSLTSCVTLGRLLNLSEPLFPASNGDHNKQVAPHLWVFISSSIKLRLDGLFLKSCFAERVLDPWC